MANQSDGRTTGRPDHPPNDHSGAGLPGRRRGVGLAPTPHYQSPRRHRATCQAARRWSEVPYVIDGLMVYVDDVDAHFRAAPGAGARVLSEPEDTGYGQRQYRVEDGACHRWMFAQRVPEAQPPEREAQVPDG